MRNGLILVSLLGWMAAGCGGSSKSGGNGGGGGTGGGSGSVADMAQTLVQPDLLTVADLAQLSCLGILNCLQTATDDGSSCVNAGTPKAQMLFNNINGCFNTECSGVSSTSTDPCLVTDNACVSCTTTGTVQTDMGPLESKPAGKCYTDSDTTTVQTSPVCASCITTIYTCQLDV
jgi:hypothetical protein